MFSGKGCKGERRNEVEESGRRWLMGWKGRESREGRDKRAKLQHAPVESVLVAIVMDSQPCSVYLISNR